MSKFSTLKYGISAMQAKRSLDDLQIGDSIVVRGSVLGRDDVFIATIVEMKRIRDTPKNHDLNKTDAEKIDTGQTTRGLN